MIGALSLGLGVRMLAAPVQAAPVVATPVLTGIRSTGTLVVRATVSGSPLNVGGTIALFRRGSSYRLDLLTLGFPGTDPTASALAGALLAPGGATLLYDGTSGALTAYSIGNHVYFQQAAKSNVTTARDTTPAAAPAAQDPLALLALVSRQLHDVERAAIQLTGHSSINGHPTDDLDIMLRRQRPGRGVEDYHAQLNLADDLDGFPVRIALTSTPPSPQDFGGSFRLDLTAVARDTPDAAIFAIPPGLTRVDSLGAVLQAAH